MGAIILLSLPPISDSSIWLVCHASPPSPIQLTSFFHRRIGYRTHHSCYLLCCGCAHTSCLRHQACIWEASIWSFTKAPRSSSDYLPNAQETPSPIYGNRYRVVLCLQSFKAYVNLRRLKRSLPNYICRTLCNREEVSASARASVGSEEHGILASYRSDSTCEGMPGRIRLWEGQHDCSSEAWNWYLYYIWRYRSTCRYSYR